MITFALSLTRRMCTRVHCVCACLRMFVSFGWAGRCKQRLEKTCVTAGRPQVQADLAKGTQFGFKSALTHVDLANVITSFLLLNCFSDALSFSNTVFVLKYNKILLIVIFTPFHSLFDQMLVWLWNYVPAFELLSKFTECANTFASTVTKSTNIPSWPTSTHNDNFNLHSCLPLYLISISI